MKKLLLFLSVLFIFSSALTAFAEDYWNDEIYKSIEQQVKANTPKFPNVDFVVTL